MKQSHDDSLQTRAERVYALLLYLYPAGHRRDYGPLLRQAFRDQVRDALATQGYLGAGFWLAVIADVIISVWDEQWSMLEGGVQVNWIWKHFGVSAGLLLGGLSIIGIVLTNVVFPSNESDSEYTALYLLAYVAIFLVFAIIGFVAGGNTNRIRTGAGAGVVAALLTTAIALATFFVVDNLFLSIVSQQVDKIQGFQQSTFPTMRDYINASLLYGTIVALPAFGAIGAVFGTLGAAARKLTTGFARAR